MFNIVIVAGAFFLGLILLSYLRVRIGEKYIIEGHNCEKRKILYNISCTIITSLYMIGAFYIVILKFININL